MTFRINRLLWGLCLLLPLGAGAQAQSQIKRHSMEITWGPSIPSGSNFTERTGWSAFTLRWEYRIIPQLAMGLSAGFDRCGENGMTEDFFNGDLVTGYTERKVTLFPLAVHARYYPIAGRTHVMQPYIGIGAGAQWARFDITGETINTSRGENWAATAMPEVGTRIYPVRGGRLWFDVKVALRFAGNSWKPAQIESLGSILPSVGMGLSF